MDQHQKLQAGVDGREIPCSLVCVWAQFDQHSRKADLQAADGRSVESILCVSDWQHLAVVYGRLLLLRILYLYHQCIQYHLDIDRDKRGMKEMWHTATALTYCPCFSKNRLWREWRTCHFSSVLCECFAVDHVSVEAMWDDCCCKGDTLGRRKEQADWLCVAWLYRAKCKLSGAGSRWLDRYCKHTHGAMWCDACVGRLHPERVDADRGICACLQDAHQRCDPEKDEPVVIQYTSWNRQTLSVHGHQDGACARRR